MRRRHFLSLSAASLAVAPAASSQSAEGMVLTVQGPVAPSALGLTLSHEHVFSIFGADPAEPASYDEAALFAAVEPYLRKLKTLGCGAIADCTAAWFGRRPDLLLRLSKASGIHLLTNTGYYGAANDRYVPKHAYSESAAQLAARWVKEFRDGIGDTGIRPGFMKIGVDGGALSDIDAKLIRAAAMTHRDTGLTIAVHTGGNPEAAKQQLAILREERVAPEAWIWVHANSTLEAGELLAAAKAGAWISLDGVAEDSVERHLSLVRRFRDEQLLHRVLLSHDGNSFRAEGRPPKPYDGLFLHFLPALRKANFTDQQIQDLTSRNPQRALTIRKRMRTA